MKTIRRPISILLAVLMVVGMFTMVPISAGAASYVAQVGTAKYETLDAAIEAAQAGETVELLADITLDAKTIDGESAKYGAYITKDLTIDGKGHTVTSNAERAFGVKGVSEEIDVTFKDITINNKQKGAICICTRGGIGDLTLDGVTLNTQGCTKGYNQPLTIGGSQATKAKVTVKDSTIQTNDDASKYYAIILWNPVDLTIQDSTIKGWACVYQKPSDSTEKTEVAIDNSTLISKGLKGTSNHFAAIMTEDADFSCEVTNSTIDVTAAENTYQGIVASNNNASGFEVELGAGNNVTLTGDTAIIGFNFDEEAHEVAVSGGTFNKAVPEAYCADGFIPVTNTDGTYTVGGPYAAKIDSTGYATLADAFAAAQDGKTITVLADCTGDGIKVAKAKFANGLTVDFNGHTYTVDGETVGSSGTETIGFQLLKGNKITFQNGTITGNSNENTDLQRMIQNYSDLTLDNMTVSMVGRYNNQITVSTCNGKTVINNSTISAPDFTWAGYDDPADVGAAALAVGTFSSYPSIDVTVEGDSTTINGDVNVSDSNNKKAFSLKLNGGKLNGKINLDENAKAAIDDTASTANVTKAADFDQAAPEGYKWVDDGEGNQTLAVANYVAQIGDDQYETLKAALDAAGANDTIELLADCTVDETYLVTKDITIDGNNKTVKATEAVEIFKFDTLTATLTVTDCTFDGDNVGLRAATTQGAKGSNNPNAVIDFTNVTVKNFVADNYAGAVYVFGNSKGNFTNCTITGNKVPAAQADLAYAGADIWAGAAATVTIGGGTYGEVFINANARSASKVIVDGDATVAELALEHDRGDASAELKNANITKLQLNDGYVGNATVTEDTVFTVPEGYKVVEGAIVPVKYVAQIGTAKYETLEAAFAAANDGEIITVLADCSGNGIVVPQGKFASGLTVDFAGFTYTVDGETVGSSGTETNGFQLLKGNNITFKGGTITSTKAKILVQNYSNLTLDGMKLTLDNQNYTSAYTLSNNNGNTVIKDTTINANPAGGFAFDVCRFKKGNTYKSVHVTVTGESKINGNVEISASNNDPKDGFSLNLNGGTMSGKIIVDPSAAAAMEKAPDKASVNKKNTFEQDPAAGYKWKDNGDGTSTLVKIPKLFTGHNITLRGDVSLNFFINTKAIENYDSSVPAKVVFTYDGTRTAEVAFADATPASDGVIVATIQVPAAFMAHKIKAVVYYNGAAQAETDEYSIQQYAETLIEHPEYTPAGKNHEDLAKLMMEMLNYGAKAQTVFAGQVKEQATYDDLTEKYDYHMATVTDDMIQAAIDAAPQNAGKTATDLSTVKPEANATFYTASVVFLSESTLKIVFKVPGGSTITGYDGSQKNTYYWVQETDIAAAQLDTLQTFTVGDATFYYSALDYAKVVLKNGNAAAQDLVSALYLYNQAANGYFGANA